MIANTTVSNVSHRSTYSVVWIITLIGDYFRMFAYMSPFHQLDRIVAL